MREKHYICEHINRLVNEVVRPAKLRKAYTPIADTEDLYAPSAGMMHRFCLKASLKAGFSVTVSLRALMSRAPI